MEQLVSTILHTWIECLVFSSRTTKLNTFTKLEMFNLKYAPTNASARDAEDTAKFAKMFRLRYQQHRRQQRRAHEARIGGTPTTNQSHTNNHISATHQPQIMGHTKHKSSANQSQITRTHYPQLIDKPTTNLVQSTNNSAAHQPRISRTPTTTHRQTKHKSAARQPQFSPAPTTNLQHTKHKSAAHKPQISSTQTTNKQHTNKSAAHQSLIRSTHHR
jgi:hypothetical protein